MKFFLLAVMPLLVLAANNNAAPDSPVAAQVPGEGPVGVTAAQQLADMRRRELHGDCGMCIFKERIGDAWVFRTLVGYAGSSAPDITVFPPKKSQPPAKEKKPIDPPAAKRNGES